MKAIPLHLCASTLRANLEKAYPTIPFNYRDDRVTHLFQKVRTDEAEIAGIKFVFASKSTGEYLSVFVDLWTCQILNPRQRATKLNCNKEDPF